MISSLALADVLNGADYFTAGVHRTYLIPNQACKNSIDQLALAFQVDSIPDSTPWQCPMTVHNFFFIPGEPDSGILLTTINIDRLIAVAWPLVSSRF